MARKDHLYLNIAVLFLVIIIVMTVLLILLEKGYEISNGFGLFD